MEKRSLCARASLIILASFIFTVPYVYAAPAVSGIELDNVQVTPIQLKSTSISVMVSKSEIMEGGSVAVSGEIEPRVSGVEVSLTYTKPDSTKVTSQISISAAGTFSDIIKPDMLGSWSVEVSWAGEGDYEGATSQSVSFTVIEESSGGIPGYPIWSIGLALLFVSIIISRTQKQ